MIRSIVVAAALFVGTVSAHASTLDFAEMGSGNLHKNALTLAQATVYSGSDSLYVGAGGMGNSVCALSSKKWNCANDLYIGFAAPVTNLSFDVGGFQQGDKVRLSVFDAAGEFAGRLGLTRGGTFDLTKFSDISALFFDDRSKAGGVSYGNFSYEAIAPVPLPASLPLLLAGIGAIGFARKKRKSA